VADDLPDEVRTKTNGLSLKFPGGAVLRVGKGVAVGMAAVILSIGLYLWYKGWIRPPGEPVAAAATRKPSKNGTREEVKELTRWRATHEAEYARRDSTFRGELNDMSRIQAVQASELKTIREEQRFIRSDAKAGYENITQRLDSLLLRAPH